MRLLTPHQVADLLQVKPSFIYRLARSGQIPHVRLGERYVRFEPEVVERWIAQKRGREADR